MQIPFPFISVDVIKRNRKRIKNNHLHHTFDKNILIIFAKKYPNYEKQVSFFVNSFHFRIHAWHNTDFVVG